MDFELPLPNLEEVRREARHLLCPRQTQAIPWHIRVDDAWFEWVPVLALRWSQDDIDSRMIFRHDEWKCRSVYETLDELVRGKISPGGIAKLEVVRHHGELYSLSNRRLTALLTYQILRRSEVVYARCVIREGPNPRWSRSFSTRSSGLDMYPNPRFYPSQAEHCGGPLFHPSQAALERVHRLLNKHPDTLRGFTVELRERDDNEDGVDCETLTLASLPSLFSDGTGISEPRQPVAVETESVVGSCAETLMGVSVKSAEVRQPSFRIFPHSDTAAFHKDLIDRSPVEVGDVKEIKGGLQIRIPDMGNINIYEGSKRVVVQGKRVQELRSVVEALTAPPDLAKARACHKKA
ncbi:unnamed protein product [Symbiodinium microadriaticum]|nr:unnamed protein product [Symbiodinium microadriaticum]